MAKIIVLICSAIWFGSFSIGAFQQWLENYFNDDSPRREIIEPDCLQFDGMATRFSFGRPRIRKTRGLCF